MRLVVQRVSQAQVEIEGKVEGAIQKGLLVFLGVHKEDKEEDIAWFVNKLLHLRIFSDSQGKMNLSVKDIEGELLVISQFTLYANCLNGRRPDFIQAAPLNLAVPIYEKFIEAVRNEWGRVQTGQFGADMKVSLINDGPVTLVVES